MPGMMRGAVGRPHEKIDKPFVLIWRVIKTMYESHKILIFVALLCLIITATCGSIGLSFISNLIKAIEKTNSTPIAEVDYSEIYRIVSTMIGFFLLTVISSYSYSRIMVVITQDTLKSVRDKLFIHMEKLPLSYFDSRTTGEIMSIYTNDTDTLRQLISQALPTSLSSIISISTMIILMFVSSWILALIAICFICLSIFVLKYNAKLSSKFFIYQQKNLGKVNGFIEEMTSGQKVIKVFNHESIAINEFNDLNKELENSNFKANMYSSFMGPLNNNLGYLSYAICAMVGAILCLQSNEILHLEVADLVVFLQFSRSLNMQMFQVTSQIAFVFQALAGANRIYKSMDEKQEIDDGYITLVNVTKDNDGILHETNELTSTWAWKNPHHKDGENLTELKGDIRFYDVDFGYIPDKIVLHDVSIYAKPGQKIAFVGATGAGKTTITNLINRFYDIQDGKIRYDGINVNKIKKEDLRNSLGIVLQDTHLFTGTIKDNIKYGKRTATDEEVIAAAKLANADGFIKMLPQGYDTIITGDGGNLSQGQRQLISIARAAIINPPVLILDEATSSIDTYTESLIQESMDKLMKGRTTFAIAHRLSTVQNSDAIMVLENGVIIERGNHDDLIKLHGKYYQLYMGAFELE